MRETLIRHRRGLSMQTMVKAGQWSSPGGYRVIVFLTSARDFSHSQWLLVPHNSLVICTTAATAYNVIANSEIELHRIC